MASLPLSGETARTSTSNRVSHDERRELDHRLANSLQLAADFLLFEHMRVTDFEARAALIATAERLSAVGQMHRFLAARRQSSGVDLEPFLTELASLISESTGLACDVDSDPIEASGDIAQQLAIAVNELAMNTAKHAYPWGEFGPLHIVCRRRGQGLALTVSDEGRGLPPEFEAKRAAKNPSRLGMAIVEAIVRQLHGLLEVRNDGGAKFTLHIPLPSRTPTSRSFAPPSGRD